MPCIVNDFKPDARPCAPENLSALLKFRVGRRIMVAIDNE
jgi:hypothetical protein